MTNIETEEALGLADFSRVDPVPEEAQAQVLEIMRTGETFRYLGKNSPASRLEEEIALYMGMPYVVVGHSCTSLIRLGLEALPGQRVLANGFTFIAPIGAAKKAGKEVVLVESDERYCMDLTDLERKAQEGDILLLSYMRGWIPDMDELLQIARERKLVLVEDIAHAWGETWRGQKLGTFDESRLAIVSFQANKIVNAGEGGAAISWNEELIVRMIISSGSYDRFHEKHFVKSSRFDELRKQIPRDNVRLDNIRAAIALPQIKLIEKKGEAFRKNYTYLVGKLTAAGHVEVPPEIPHAVRIPDSIQFRIPGFSKEQMLGVMDKVQKAGLSFSAIGADPYNDRAFWNWEFLGEIPDLPHTREILATTCDMRLLSSWDERHFDYIAKTVNSAISEVS